MNELLNRARRAQIFGPAVSAPPPATQQRPPHDEFWDSESEKPVGETIGEAAPVEEDEDPERAALREHGAALIEEAKLPKTAPSRDSLEYKLEQIVPKLKVRASATLQDLIAVSKTISAEMPENHIERLMGICREAADMSIGDALEHLHGLSDKYLGHPNVAPLGKALVKIQSAYRRSLARQNPAFSNRIGEIDAGWDKFNKAPQPMLVAAPPANVLFATAASGGNK